MSAISPFEPVTISASPPDPLLLTLVSGTFNTVVLTAYPEPAFTTDPFSIPSTSNETATPDPEPPVKSTPFEPCP